MQICSGNKPWEKIAKTATFWCCALYSGGNVAGHTSWHALKKWGSRSSWRTWDAAWKSVPLLTAGRKQSDSDKVVASDHLRWSHSACSTEQNMCQVRSTWHSIYELQVLTAVDNGISLCKDSNAHSLISLEVQQERMKPVGDRLELLLWPLLLWHYLLVTKRASGPQKMCATYPQIVCSTTMVHEEKWPTQVYLENGCYKRFSTNGITVCCFSLDNIIDNIIDNSTEISDSNQKLWQHAASTGDTLYHYH